MPCVLILLAIVEIGVSRPTLLMTIVPRVRSNMGMLSLGVVRFVLLTTSKLRKLNNGRLPLPSKCGVSRRAEMTYGNNTVRSCSRLAWECLVAARNDVRS